jgi:purine-binding chemotaxis protein CheW
MNAPDAMHDAHEQRVLRERARQLARRPEQAPTGEEVDVLLFRLCDETYAVELRLLRAVQQSAGLVPVPCTPPHVAGMISIRGEIITVLDLAFLLGLRHDTFHEQRNLLVADSPHGRVGLLVDEVVDIRRLQVAMLHRGLSSRESTRGIAEATIILLDLEHLLAGDHLEVAEDVG